MLYSLYLCISQNRLAPITNIPQISVVLHNDILILIHVIIQCRLVARSWLYIIVTWRPTLFPSSLNL